MNSINISALNVHFSNPWLLFVIIPALALMLFPYFRLKKQHRRTRNRVISLAFHTVILVCVTLLLAGLTFTYTQVNVKRDVILLVDVSDSIQGSEDEMTDFVKTVLSDIDPDYEVGVVTFANECVYSQKMSASSVSADKIFSPDSSPEGYATDISSALLYSRERLSSPQDGRIILLSDGRQTDGNAMVTVKALADEGIRVDTVYFPSKGYNREVQITSAEAGMTDEVTAEILVTAQSTVAQPAVLSLYDNGKLLTQQSVNLSGGEDVFSIKQRLPVSSLHVISVNIAAEQDTLTQNNTYYTYINLETSTKTLLVDGSGRETEGLSGILDESFDVTKITLDRLPTTIDELCRYNEIILMNVANADLPAGFDKILTDYVKVYGGGLYTVGGDKAYAQSDMNGTKYEELLPIVANTDAKTLGLLLIIDNSGSMDEKVGNSTRMELAIDAAVASVECLSPDDYVGVLCFDQNVTKVIEMSSMDRKDTVINRIKGIQPGYGTYYYNALNEARVWLQTFDKTELKHIIFLTDGERTDTNITDKDIMSLIDRMARNDITLSTIALGASVKTDVTKEMAERGGGRFYSVVKENELKRIMVEETTTAAGHYLNEFVFTPSIVGHTAAVAGISAMPKLGGFYGSRIKDGATMVLGYEGSPIYAEWSCGAGRVGSFMCDLYGDWSAELFTDENGIRFITNTVSSLLSKELNKNGGDISVEFANGNFTSQAIITARLEAGETLVAQVISPDGKTTHLKLEQLSEKSFASYFTTDTAGIYTLNVSKIGGGSDQAYLSYTAFSYSKEYLAFADDNACFEFMESLSENGNGSMLFSAENLFGKNNESVESDYNPALALLIICSVLFLLDIVVRKFKIKLPSEIREERKNQLSSGTINE